VRDWVRPKNSEKEGAKFLLIPLLFRASGNRNCNFSSFSPEPQGAPENGLKIILEFLLVSGPFPFPVKGNWDWAEIALFK
jgi:hypothetical protein